MIGIKRQPSDGNHSDNNKHGEGKKPQQKLIPKMLQNYFSGKSKAEACILTFILAVFCFTYFAPNAAIDSISSWN